MALLFFSPPPSFPQRFPILLNNPTFSSMLCFQPSKQVLSMPQCNIQNSFRIKKKIRQADKAIFSLSSETGLDLAGMSCSLVGIQAPGWMLGSKSKTKHEKISFSPLYLLCHPPDFDCQFFFLFSPEVVRTLLSEMSGDLFWLLQCFFHQFSWKIRGEGTMQYLCQLWQLRLQGC